jgi:hypothetical protein
MEVHLQRNPTLSVKEKALRIAYQPMLRPWYILGGKVALRESLT